MTLNINKTIKPAADTQLYYLYAGVNDTPFTPETMPTIYVDGVLDENPIIRG